MKGDATSSSLITSSTQPSENELSSFFLTSAKSLDDEMIPCCSKNISSFLKAPASPSGSTSSGQMKITNFLPIKKLTKTRKIKFGKLTKTRIGGKNLKKSHSMIGSVEDVESNVALSESASTSQTLSPSSKLLKKKKRSLKSERKKSRSQKPLLH